MRSGVTVGQGQRRDGSSQKGWWGDGGATLVTVRTLAFSLSERGSAEQRNDTL